MPFTRVRRAKSMSALVSSDAEVVLRFSRSDQLFQYAICCWNECELYKSRLNKTSLWNRGVLCVRNWTTIVFAKVGNGKVILIGQTAPRRRARMERSSRAAQPQPYNMKHQAQRGKRENGTWQMNNNLDPYEWDAAGTAARDINLTSEEEACYRSRRGRS